MGEIRVKVRFENEMDASLCQLGKLAKRKVRAVKVEAIVDTGAVMMLLPQELVERLGLRIIDKTTVTLADDRKVEMDRAGGVCVTIAERSMVIDCLVGPPGSAPLIGQLLIEGLDLIPDPVKRTLTPRPESPFRPTLNMRLSARPGRGLALARA